MEYWHSENKFILNSPPLESISQTINESLRGGHVEAASCRFKSGGTPLPLLPSLDLISEGDKFTLGWPRPMVYFDSSL